MLLTLAPTSKSFKLRLWRLRAKCAVGARVEEPLVPGLVDPPAVTVIRPPIVLIVLPHPVLKGTCEDMVDVERAIVIDLDPLR
jgi:hypothetical protein